MYYQFLVFPLVISLAVSQGDVRRPPKITESSPEALPAFKERGPKLNLVCVATGIPNDIEYEWLKDEQTLDLNSATVTTLNDGNIRLEAASESEGYYQCIARNNYGAAYGNIIHVPEAKLIYPQEDAPQVMTKRSGESAELPCLVQESVPTSALQWKTVDQDHVQEHDTTPEDIVLGKRISQSPDGTLYFSYVIEEDSRVDQKYRCFARNPTLGTTKEGSDVILEVTGVNIVERAPALMTPSDDVVALEGEKFSLKCFFSAYPEASVKWDYSATNPPAERRSLKDSDTLLEISNVQKSDAGPYMCWGQNSQGSSTRTTINVDVQSKPRFEGSGLEDIEGIQGQSATFQCATSADPKATVTWYINGEPIRPDDLGAHRTLSEDNTALTFTELCKMEDFCTPRKPDLLNVQCSASNIHGYVYRSAYLNVLLPTVITVKPPAQVALKENQTEVTFKCQATTDPILTPELSWWHEDTRVYNETDARYMIDVHNTLHIDFRNAADDVIRKFMGGYSCRVVAGESTARANVYLTSYVPIAEPVKSAILQYWWVFVVVVAVLLLVILIVCWCVWCKKNEKFDYHVDDYERKTGHDPEKELQDQAFQDYVRPSRMAPAHSRENMDMWQEIDDMKPYDKNSLHSSKHSLNSLGRPTITLNQDTRKNDSFA